MIAYVDSSVVARKLLSEPEPLAEWSQIQEAYASRLMPLELGRLIDRLRLTGQIDDAEVEQLQVELRRVLRAVDVVALSERILKRAGEAMPTVLGALDSVHLATALEVAAHAPGLCLATHDAQLARAARASGLVVCGA